MDIAISSPIDIHAIARSMELCVEGIPKGLGSTAVTPLILEYLRRGHQVTVFTLSRDLEECKEYEWGKFRLLVAPMRQRHVGRNYFKPEIAFLSEFIRREKPRFVHAHWTYEFALGSLRAGIPTITTIHDLPWNIFKYHRDFYRLVRVIMAYEVGARGKMFTAVSEDAAEHFRSYFNPKAKIRIVPNGLSNEVFDIGSTTSRIPSGEFHFATILQGWSELKNASVVLKAFAKVRDTHKNVRLLMYGDGYEKNGPAHQWAKPRNLDNAVSFEGGMPHHGLLMRESQEVDVLIHPSLSESFSLVAAEAMALGKPVIAGKATSGVTEVLGKGEAGLLVDIRDHRMLADAMASLLRDDQLRARYEQVGKDRAFKAYRLSHIADLYLREYEGLLV